MTSVFGSERSSLNEYEWWRLSWIFLAGHWWPGSLWAVLGTSLMMIVNQTSNTQHGLHQTCLLLLIKMKLMSVDKRLRSYYLLSRSLYFTTHAQIFYKAPIRFLLVSSVTKPQAGQSNESPGICHFVTAGPMRRRLSRRCHQTGRWQPIRTDGHDEMRRVTRVHFIEPSSPVKSAGHQSV